MAGTDISKQAMMRMPYYLRYLRDAEASGALSVSSTAIGEALRLNSVQVRKDLAAVCSSKGKPGSGFNVRELISGIEELLGYNSRVDAVLVGAGSLGTALLSYKGFSEYGMNIVAAFDSSASVCGRVIGGREVLDASSLEDFCRNNSVHIGIITVPADVAQDVCSELIRGGVKAIWNFAPVKLKVPAGILIQNENLAASLAVLSRHLKNMSDAANG